MSSVISEWIRCPVWGNKTRDRIREAEANNYPFYCPKCKQGA